MDGARHGAVALIGLDDQVGRPGQSVGGLENGVPIRGVAEGERPEDRLAAGHARPAAKGKAAGNNMGALVLLEIIIIARQEGEKRTQFFSHLRAGRGRIKIVLAAGQSNLARVERWSPPDTWIRSTSQDGSDVGGRDLVCLRGGIFVERRWKKCFFQKLNEDGHGPRLSGV